MKRFYCTNCGSEIFVGSKSPRETLKRPYNDYCSMCNSRSLKRVPDFETPEQYKERTGNKYPENAAVRVFYSPKHGWDLMEYWQAKQLVQDLWRLDNDYDVDLELIPIVCDCGVDGPPPDNWRPEET